MIKKKLKFQNFNAKHKWQCFYKVQELMGTFQETKDKVEELQTSVQSLESTAEDSRFESWEINNNNNENWIHNLIYK